jgi:hypothetical protein
MKNYIFKALFAALFVLVSCLAYSSTLKTEPTRSSETSADLNGLQSIIAQKTELLK